MPLVQLSFDHGRPLDEARARLAQAVGDLQRSLGSLAQRVEWTEDRSRVVVAGPGYEMRLWVDPQKIHIEGDVPLLGKLLGSPILGKLKQVVEDRFQKKLEQR